MPQAYSFYPSTKRRFVGNLIFFLVYIFGQMLFNSYQSVGYYLGLGVIFLIVSFVFAYDNSDAIKIARGTIAGPTLSGFKQTEFELTAIDKRRTKQQSLWNKLNGR